MAQPTAPWQHGLAECTSSTLRKRTMPMWTRMNVYEPLFRAFLSTGLEVNPWRNIRPAGDGF